MNRRNLAVAIAGVLAFPGAAFSQSSVSISGYLKVAMENIRLGNSARPNSSENRIADENSRIIFTMVEDLGGGVQAIGQVDWRITTDVGADSMSGNNWVGLRSKSWGQFVFGRSDLHYKQLDVGDLVQRLLQGANHCDPDVRRRRRDGDRKR
jgi:predicted porin